ncbi:MAG: hypothetical protein RL148_1156 [Planctomycetota bacterium]
MRLRRSIELGVATHTGMQRSANEDDYVVLSAVDEPGAADLFAVADGMGGMAGGAEASRAALRGLALGFRGWRGTDPLDGLRAGFSAACARVGELAGQLPALRDMGTTLTAIAVGPGGAALVHVGDCRALRLRGRQLEQLTVDHARTDLDHVLTRCIGAGMPPPQPDSGPVVLQEGDTVALLTDGVWKPVGPEAVARLLQGGSAQEAAERLVAAALAAGGPDNATALVVRLRGGSGVPEQFELPREELAAMPARSTRSLLAPRWPLLLLGAAAVLLALVGLRALGWFDVANLLGG